LNEKLLHTEVQRFINTNLKTDLPTLILKGSHFKGISIQELAQQVLSKSKCHTKLPTWFQTEKIYYPKAVNIEQTSSEITAHYKSTLLSGRSLIDLTGGFGVDAYFFSKRFDLVTHCEIDEELSEIVSYNFGSMGVKNIECQNEDGISFIEKTEFHYDWIYVDPSRRNELKTKVFRLEECLPDISIHLETFLMHSNNIMVKLSPFLDITATIDRLQFVKEVHIVAVKNEVKELLVHIEKGYKGTCHLKAVNITKDKKDVFEGVFPSQEEPRFSKARKYLFEPNSAILKSGFFNEVSTQLNLYKLHINSHLYTSDILVDFPGRSFEIIAVFKYNKKQIKRNFGSKKANITTRNFHDTVAQIRKKTGIKEGGDDFLFFTTDIEDNAIMIQCKKV
jgi:16S rRNA G966 N2-methylase RsmD